MGVGVPRIVKGSIGIALVMFKDITSVTENQVEKNMEHAHEGSGCGLSAELRSSCRILCEVCSTIVTQCT